MKKSVIVANCGQTFFFKSKCKYCISGPKYVSYMMNKMITQDSLYPMKEFYESYFGTKRSDDCYLDYLVRSRNFSGSFIFDSATALLRRLPVPNMKYKQNEDKITTVIECECGRTSWAFVNSNRKHISNRKSGTKLNTRDVVSLYKVMF